MSEKEDSEPILEQMRRDWNERATQDAQQYVYTRDVDTDESDFEVSGRVNYDQLVRPFLPVLLCGRSPNSTPASTFRARKSSTRSTAMSASR